VCILKTFNARTTFIEGGGGRAEGSDIAGHKCGNFTLMRR